LHGSQSSLRWVLPLAAPRELVVRRQQEVPPRRLAAPDQTSEDPQVQAALAAFQARPQIQVAPRHQAAMVEVW